MKCPKSRLKRDTGMALKTMIDGFQDEISPNIKK